MKWALKLGRFAGIDVFLHATFPLIIVWVGLNYWLQTRTLAGTLEGVLFILMIFSFVVLHEFGHALTARRYGIPTRDITLYPIGGVARLERMPDKPIQELWVALAGPAVNVVIAIAIFGWLVISGALAPLASISLTTGPFIERLMMVNISLVLFNLIPAFPMDGGRVLRALLALRLEYPRATQIAATVGQGMAVLLGIFGLLGNPFLLFIAYFVWTTAAQEAMAVKIKSALEGVSVGQVMLTSFQALSPHDSLHRAVGLILSSSQTEFPVVEDGAILGVLSRSEMVTDLGELGQDAPVAGSMRRDFQLVDVNEMLEEAIARLQACDCQTLFVTQRGLLVGLLTADNIGKYLMIQPALRKANSQNRLVARGT